mmetsp:Transcript_26655/g.30309  ORF Transcript_26655/g.30309 Transcript_26655/m.30309 type:complete len:188 (-) Transcript_26655:44-607(-)
MATWPTNGTLGNFDFFHELTATSEEWKGWLANKQQLLDELIAEDDYDHLNPSQCPLESRLREGLERRQHESRKRQCESPIADNNYDPIDSSPKQLRHLSRLCEVSLIADNDDDFFYASIGYHQHAGHQHAICSPRRPPSFISRLGGTLFRVLSRNNSQEILDTPRTDLENICYCKVNFVQDVCCRCL